MIFDELVKKTTIENFGRTDAFLLLYLAILRGNRYVLEKWPNRNDFLLKGKEERTLLHRAAKEGSKEIVEYLITKTPAQKLINNHTSLANGSWTALHLAVERRNLEIVKVFVNCLGAKIEIKEKNKWTILHVATVNGHWNVLNYLIKQPAARKLIDAQISQGDGSWTALHLAVNQGHLESVKYLIDGRANIEIKAKTDWTILHLAAWKGHWNVLNYLIEKTEAKKLIDAQTSSAPGSWTALYLAVKEGHLEAVKCLIAWGANIGIKEMSHRNILYTAICNDRWDIMAYLIDSAEAENLIDAQSRFELFLCSASQGALVQAAVKGKLSAFRGISSYYLSLNLKSLPAKKKIWLLSDFTVMPHRVVGVYSVTREVIFSLSDEHCE